ncbi:MAG: 50S ribosomal protein L22 [Holosporaceae bacterium]|jgi:large subunit ribosomal protein L22|nr:50S ribosomal protein L22 [Holosporaceae bacterium]
MAKRLRIPSTSFDVVAKNKIILASPRKLNLVARLIRGMSAEKAMDTLLFCKKAVAKDVRKTLISAVANAEENYNLNVDLLTVREAYVGKAIALKRFVARAKGRAGPIRKKFSRLTVVLCESRT